MSNDGISVPYNRDLKALEELLSGVRRPGDFFALGSLETPMPRVEVEGVGLISFPVPEAQIQQLIQQATRAPYGRGEETLHDDTVRRTWQLSATHVTERKGSPQTLVCTKTRRTFQRQCEQHRADCASMNALLDLMCPVRDALGALAKRLAAAKELKPKA